MSPTAFSFLYLHLANPPSRLWSFPTHFPASLPYYSNWQFHQCSTKPALPLLEYLPQVIVFSLVIETLGGLVIVSCFFCSNFKSTIWSIDIASIYLTIRKNFLTTPRFLPPVWPRGIIFACSYR